MPSVESMEKELADYQKQLERARESGSTSRIESYEERIVKLKRDIKKEESTIHPHPSLQFGPVAQTVAIMAAISLGLSVANLPKEMQAFYCLFSKLTIVAVTCLVVHSSIVWYGYNEAIKKIPPKETPDQKLRAMMKKSKPDRADLWAHTRSHPSAFLTTKHAPPRLFPFPLGKSRPEAAVKDELWWEGGNAPHVGHFNKPKLESIPPLDEETLLNRVKASMELEKQQKLWKKRIRTIQYLCMVIICSYVNRVVAVVGTCWLVYSTVANELDSMLKPPPDMTEINSYIRQMVSKAGRNQSAPKAGRAEPTGGMGYIYDQREAKHVKPNSNIPINVVPPHVLMTTENHWLAGPGEVIKDPDK